jgi:hypothetical protein
MATRWTRYRPVARFLLSAALVAAGFGLIGSTPASAWCKPAAVGSGQKPWGEETYRGSTCDGDRYYAGKVRDSPTVSDGKCAHIRLYSGGWFTQAYACSSSWVNYSVSNAPAYPTKLCKGTTSVCSLGSYSGA